MTTHIPSEHDLHAYVDGQLDPELHRQIDSYLVSHPDLAREVEQLRLDNQRVRAAIASIPVTPIPARLDPQRIRRELRSRSQRTLAIAASLMLTLGLGTMGGWQLRELSMRKTYLPMADATQAYRLFATNDMLQKVDLKTSEPAQLQNWLNQHFVQTAAAPDFSAYGFKLFGARLMASDKGAAAMVVYQNSEGQAILYYVRSPGELFNFGAGNRKDGNLLTQYWRQGRYFYAVVSPSDSLTAMPVQQAIEPTRPSS
ncbi:anti-sigma factor RsiW [Herbaspirillum sp. Sphag1AN]|uniref:anti-sigma factor family protein n=1 Tax=unclassified Herbaspirillum TaxID=2624150 RepID=UPI00160A1255|nr:MULTISPECIES: anti-sigma factor [unclassified Herbaspirillum]MBB3214237.1 anti-sigma factor RsiW [Herbaspirillum sp. Sphag1AN]MBB3247211.1 anti-sigma factor RsiW [Herbaspirillum sp. Sphag64]